ncbi:unnamed protein product [Commensalibacter communis]|nr:unnamed protein product [Commensalibacter communis]
MNRRISYPTNDVVKFMNYMNNLLLLINMYYLTYDLKVKLFESNFS